MIQNNFNSGKRALGTIALSAAVVFAGVGSATAQSSEREVRLDAGTVIPVTLNTSLSSKSANRGDPFTATVRADQTQDYGLPDGTRVDGVVDSARPREGNNPGMLDLSFRRIRLPDGRSYQISGSLIGLDNKSVEKTSSGRLIATPDHTNKRLTYVGYGAGAGLIVGILTKHTLEDTLIGGGLGYLFGALQKGESKARDVVLKPGTEIGVRLDRSTVLTTYGGEYNNYNNNDNYQNNNGYRNTEDSGRYHRSAPSGNGYASSSVPTIGVLIGENNVNFSSNAQPILSHGTVLVPVRPVLDQANIPYTWNSAGKYIRATGDGGTVRMALGSSIAVVNGSRRVWLGTPAQRLNGTIYVPTKFFGLVTGHPVTYDAGSRTVVLDMPQMQDNGDNNR